MKANELMIGDWLSLTKKGDIAPCVVTALYPKELAVLQPEWSAGEVFSYDTIYPIPISAEILEKNGWDGMNDYLRYGSASGIFNDDYKCEIGFDRSGGCFLVYNGWEYTICEIKGVHELQHALRLCGLNDLADNFKV